MKPAGVSVITVIILALLILSSGCTGPASPAGPVPLEKPVFVNATTNETLVAFVHEAVAYAKIHGKDAALAEFSNPEGSFVRGELYIFAYDFASTTLAHPFSPEKIGINRMNEPDAFGNLYAQGFIDAINKGDGFVWFYYKNPAHNDSIEKKLGYVAKVDDDWWLGSGVYYGPAEPVIPPIQKSPSTTQEIKDFVDSAVAYAQENGKDAALAMFNDP
ncbi:MAG: histidine kinase, partial [Methanomicrobiales archaeon]|nr:histidine kinase [Methanomicrobiales archaeon]